MEARERILQAATSLLEEKDPSKVTVRDICKRAGTGLGLVNYYFGSRAKLIETCVECIIRGIVAEFERIRERTQSLSPWEKLQALGDLTFTYLFDHEAIARISITADTKDPQRNDNTHRTELAFRPLVAACRPDLDAGAVQMKTHALIAAMQSAFMRSRVLLDAEGIDLHAPEIRAGYHREMLAALGLTEAAVPVRLLP